VYGSASRADKRPSAETPRRIFALFEEVLKRPLPAEKAGLPARAGKPGAKAAGM